MKAADLSEHHVTSLCRTYTPLGTSRNVMDRAGQEGLVFQEMNFYFLIYLSFD